MLGHETSNNDEVVDAVNADHICAVDRDKIWSIWKTCRSSIYQRQYAQIQQIIFCSKQCKCHPHKHLYITFWTNIIALLVHRLHCWTSLHRSTSWCYLCSRVGDFIDSILLRMFDQKEFDRLKVAASKWLIHGWKFLSWLWWYSADGWWKVWTRMSHLLFDSLAGENLFKDISENRNKHSVWRTL
jgi:hypothetical protein